MLVSANTSKLWVQATSDHSVITSGKYINSLGSRGAVARAGPRRKRCRIKLRCVASDRMGSPNGIGIVPRLPFYTLDEINIGAGSRNFDTSSSWLRAEIHVAYLHGS
jgi:hypothetical protein